MNNLECGRALPSSKTKTLHLQLMIKWHLLHWLRLKTLWYYRKPKIYRFTPVNLMDSEPFWKEQ